MSHACPAGERRLLSSSHRACDGSSTHRGGVLGPFVQTGMRVVEPGCGMGFFTLDLAANGRVRGAGWWRSTCSRPARAACGVGPPGADRLEDRRPRRPASPGRPPTCIDDLVGQVDLALGLLRRCTKPRTSAASLSSELTRSLKCRTGGCWSRSPLASGRLPRGVRGLSRSAAERASSGGPARGSAAAGRPSSRGLTADRLTSPAAREAHSIAGGSLGVARNGLRSDPRNLIRFEPA